MATEAGVLTDEQREEIRRRREPKGAQTETVQPSFPPAPLQPLAILALGSSGVKFARYILDMLRSMGADASCLFYDSIPPGTHTPLFEPDPQFSYREPLTVVADDLSSLRSWPETARRAYFRGITLLERTTDGAGGHAPIGHVLFDGAIARVRSVLYDLFAPHVPASAQRGAGFFAEGEHPRPTIQVLVPFSSCGGTGRGGALRAMAELDELGEALGLNIEVVPVVIGAGAFVGAHDRIEINDAACRRELEMFAEGGIYATGYRRARLREGVIHRGRVLWFDQRLPIGRDGKVAERVRERFIAAAAVAVGCGVVGGGLKQAWARQDGGDDRGLVTTLRVSGLVFDRVKLAWELQQTLDIRLRETLGHAIEPGNP